MRTLSIQSGKRVEMIDITSRDQEALDESRIKEGLCAVYVPHTTAGITVNEGADPSVCVDIMDYLSRLVPERGNYRHFEGNSDAHIKTTIVGASETVLVEKGRLSLGRWQRIFFCEFDGPRSRNVWVMVLGG